MNEIELRVFTELLMVSDPWPLVDTPEQPTHSEETHAVMQNLADEEAKRLGYSDWIDAYHKL